MKDADIKVGDTVRRKKKYQRENWPFGDAEKKVTNAWYDTDEIAVEGHNEQWCMSFFDILPPPKEPTP